jgi:O-antigen ligase
MFGPGIVLHPHDDALQLWLELGLVGVLLAAGVWWSAVSRLARPVRDLGAATVVASAGVYLLFGALNFGVWQEWWLALAALIAVVAGLMADQAAPSRAST